VRPCIIGAAVILGHEVSGGHGPAGAALPGQEVRGHKIDYNDKDGGQRHKKEGADDNNKQQERSFDDTRQR
jgi:hypothetical protein